MDDLFLAGMVVITLLMLLVSVQFFRNHDRFAKRCPRLRLVAGNGLVLSIALCVVTLSGECYYRFLYDSTDSYGLSRTTGKWFSDHFQLNQSDFRDEVEYLPEIPRGKTRITFIGDSFTAGHGINAVEHRFANLIRSSTQYEVHALARCGWDTCDHIELLDLTRRMDYELDVVVLVYCLNDISDLLPEWNRLLDELYGQPSPGFPVEHSYFLNTIYHRLRLATMPELSSYFSFVSAGYSGEVWERQQDRLTQICGDVRSRGGKFLVVTFPFLHALEDDYQFRDIHQKLSDHWLSLRVPHLDLLETFEDHRSSDVMVNAFDAHPNPFAHRLAADVILDFLDSQLTQVELKGDERR